MRIFFLIDREQKRPSSPRKGILKTIYVFMGVNFLGAALVAFAGLLSQPKQKEDVFGGLTSDTYLVDYTSYLVDLTQWTEEAKGPVIVTRTNFVRKVSDTKEDYTIPYFTTGDSIICDPISFSSPPRFVGPKNDSDRKGIHYDYVLPIGHQPAGYSEMVSSKFTFPTGFKDSNKEWWQARIGYPSKTISVIFRFPEGKPAKKLLVSRRRGDEAPNPIYDKTPKIGLSDSLKPIGC